jgi:hypothetical protein
MSRSRLLLIVVGLVVALILSGLEGVNGIARRTPNAASDDVPSKNRIGDHP